MAENIISGAMELGRTESTKKAENSRNYQKRGRKNTRGINLAEQWIQILVDILVEGKDYGISAQPVNYQKDSALIRLPGLRVCSGSGSGSHLVFSRDMPEGSNICVKCQKGTNKDEFESSASESGTSNQGRDSGKADDVSVVRSNEGTMGV